MPWAVSIIIPTFTDLTLLIPKQLSLSARSYSAAQFTERTFSWFFPQSPDSLGIDNELLARPGHLLQSVVLLMTL